MTFDCSPSIPRDWILSLICLTNTSPCLQTISDLCQPFGLQIVACQKLSSNDSQKNHSTQNDTQEPDVLEVSLKQQGSFCKQEWIHALLQKHQQGLFDFAVQAATPFYQRPRLVMFDVDMTFLQCEVIDELACLSGEDHAVKAITHQTMLGHLDFKQALEQRVALLKGIQVGAMNQICENLPYTQGIQVLVPILKTMGCEVGIVSGGFDFLANCLKKEFGLHHAYANQLEIQQGRLTGRLLGQIVDADQKGKIVKAIAEQQGLFPEQVITVGDGANDLQMLQFAGLGVAFNAKPVVKASATGVLSTPDISRLLYFLGFSAFEQHQLKQKLGL